MTKKDLESLEAKYITLLNEADNVFDYEQAYIALATIQVALMLKRWNR